MSSKKKKTLTPVRLVVGGTSFLTSIEALSLGADKCSYGNDVLECLVEEAKASEVSTCFLERDPRSYSFIIQYLNTGKLTGVDCVSQLIAEAKYLGLDELREKASTGNFFSFRNKHVVHHDSPTTKKYQLKEGKGPFASAFGRTMPDLYNSGDTRGSENPVTRSGSSSPLTRGMSSGNNSPVTHGMGAGARPASPLMKNGNASPITRGMSSGNNSPPGRGMGAGARLASANSSPTTRGMPTGNVSPIARGAASGNSSPGTRNPSAPMSPIAKGAGRAPGGGRSADAGPRPQSVLPQSVLARCSSDSDLYGEGLMSPMIQGRSGGGPVEMMSGKPGSSLDMGNPSPLNLGGSFSSSRGGASPPPGGAKSRQNPPLAKAGSLSKRQEKWVTDPGLPTGVFGRTESEEGDVRAEELMRLTTALEMDFDLRSEEESEEENHGDDEKRYSSMGMMRTGSLTNRDAISLLKKIQSV